MTPGRLLRFQVAFTAPDGFFSRDTIAMPAGTPTLLHRTTHPRGWGTGSPRRGESSPTIPRIRAAYFADSPGGPTAQSSTTTHAQRTARPLGRRPRLRALRVALGVRAGLMTPGVEASLDGVDLDAAARHGHDAGSGLELQNQPLTSRYYAGAAGSGSRSVADLSAFAGRPRPRCASASASSPMAAIDMVRIRRLRVRLAAHRDLRPRGAARAGRGRRRRGPRRSRSRAPSPNPVRAAARASRFALPRAGRCGSRSSTSGTPRAHARRPDARAGRYVRGWDLRDEAGTPSRRGSTCPSHRGRRRVTRRFVVVE